MTDAKKDITIDAHPFIDNVLLRCMASLFPFKREVESLVPFKEDKG